jgi:hypothetical protein
MLLEQNQSKHALNKNLKGGFYLRKKPLEGCAPGYSYSDFAKEPKLQKTRLEIKNHQPRSRVVAWVLRIAC